MTGEKLEQDRKPTANIKRDRRNAPNKTPR